MRAIDGLWERPESLPRNGQLFGVSYNLAPFQGGMQNHACLSMNAFFLHWQNLHYTQSVVAISCQLRYESLLLRGLKSGKQRLRYLFVPDAQGCSR